jgi:Xaa-Pro aminopeptidase
MTTPSTARIMAGIPRLNAALYRRIRFLVGDPVAWIEVVDAVGCSQSALILRDIEMERASRDARCDRVFCPRDFEPEGGLSGDRETATAQAAAEYLRRQGIRQVIGDRSLPFLFVDILRAIGIAVDCDHDWGVRERRQKDEEELRYIERAQQVTEAVMRRACETVGDATAQADGVLWTLGEPLTSERLRSDIDRWLLDYGFANPTSIVAGGPAGADCHEHGHGALHTGQPIIIDIFPQDKTTLYHGDCTRTVVHGEVPPPVTAMHAAVVAAKAAATAAVRAGTTGHAVHQATAEAIRRHGYGMQLPGPHDSVHYTAMTHGTGHGLGLEVHEPPLLADRGPELLVGDVVTIEPGLYCRAIGGVRIEDMVMVTAAGCRNFNRLPEGLTWRS